MSQYHFHEDGEEICGRTFQGGYGARMIHPDGRPWRNHARVRLENCYLGKHINPAGWHDWDKPESHSTVSFAETGSYGPGFVPEARPDYVKIF